MLEIAICLLIGIVAWASVMVGVYQIDWYLWKCKRIREINERHAEFMLRMGMNPGYMSHNLPMCTPSRGNYHWAHSSIPELDERSPVRIEEQSAHWNDRVKESIPDGAEIHSVEASIPGWDGTFIHLDVDAIPAPELFKIPEEVSNDNDET